MSTDWFWVAVSNFSQTEMARLLQFTTGCSQLPHGGFQVSCFFIRLHKRQSLIECTECSLFWPFCIAGIESKIPNHCSADIRKPLAHGPHLLQSTVPARLRELRAVWASANYRHQRRKWGIWNELSWQIIFDQIDRKNQNPSVKLNSKQATKKPFIAIITMQTRIRRYWQFSWSLQKQNNFSEKNLLKAKATFRVVSMP